MDWLKAFGILNQDMLLNNLTYSGIGDSINALLKSYLSNSNQYV